MKTLLFKFFSLFFLRQKFSIDFIGLGLAIYTKLALNSLRSTYSDSLSVGSKVCTTTPGSCSDMWRHVNSESQVLFLASFLCMRPLWYSNNETMEGQAGVIPRVLCSVVAFLKKAKENISLNASVLQKNRVLPIILCYKCRGNLLTSQKSRLCFYDEGKAVSCTPTGLLYRGSQELWEWINSWVFQTVFAYSLSARDCVSSVVSDRVVYWGSQGHLIWKGEFMERMLTI